MITVLDFYHVMTAVVPLYVAMIIAYGSVKWWKIFTPDQCSGINRFVALFAVPLLSFHFISTNNPYEMNYRFIAADTLQKLMVLAVLTVWANISRRGCLEWTITLFSLSSLPNTLVMGIPLLKGMYGEFSGSLMVQIVVLQCIIWYTLMLFMFEFRGARMLISEQFPDTAGSIVSFKVDTDVVSLDGREALQADAEVGEDGKLHVTVRKSTSSRSEIFSRQGLTPRPSNLTNAEIYSLQSSRNPTPRGSSFNHTDFYSMVAGGRSNMSPRHSNFGPADAYSRGPTPRPSNYEDEAHNQHHHHGHLPPPSRTRLSAGPWHYPTPNTGMFSPKPHPSSTPAVGQVGKQANGNRQTDEPGKDLHMFVWSSSASPVSEGGLHVFGGSQEYGNEPNVKEVKMVVSPTNDRHPTKGEMNWEEYERDACSFGNRGEEREAGHGQGKLGAGAASGLDHNARYGKPTSMPPTSVMTRLILIMVWRKLIRNPNTYSSLFGVTWSLVCFKWHVTMPAIISKSISILSDAGLGMAMFSLGLFMALQPRIIACGNSVAASAMAVRFLAGPAVMAAASFAVGLRGVLLHVAIVQGDIRHADSFAYNSGVLHTTGAMKGRCGETTILKFLVAHVVLARHLEGHSWGTSHDKEEIQTDRKRCRGRERMMEISLGSLRSRVF